MKNNKLNHILALATVGASLLIGATHSSQAAVSIGANFIGRNAPAAALSPSDSAGVIAQVFWNNVDSGDPVAVGTTDPLIASDGSFTAVDLDYNAPDSWSSDGPVATPNDRLMKGIIKFTTTSGTLTFKNLPAGTTYDAYVYCDENGTGAEGWIAIGTVTNYIKLENSFSGTFTLYPPSTPGAPVAGNYALWSGVSPAADGTITLSGVKTSTANDGIGIAGFQLVQVSGPALPPNTATCSITSDPASVKALEGAAVQFTVGTQGPCKVQWKKNGVDIAGATSPTLVPPFTVADNGASFVAVVYNNVNTNTSAAATLTAYSATRGISASFIGRGNDQFLNPTDSAGVLVASHWNNSAPGGVLTGSTGPLDNDAGEFTKIDLQFTFPDSWNSDGPTVTPNDKMMKGIMKVQNLNAANPTRNPAGTIVLKNFDPTGIFDIYTYHTENGADIACNVNVTIGATTYYIQMPASFNGTFTRATSTTSGTYDPANYLLFSGVQPEADGTITIDLLADPSQNATSDGMGIAGVQIFQVSGPAIATNVVPVVITSQPVDTAAVIGGVNPSFSVAVSGPAKFQWAKNGTDIAGATSTTYSFTPTLADNGAVFTVRAFNNINSVTSVPATLIVDPPGTPVLTQGFMAIERWENIGGNTGAQGITDLTNAIVAGAATVTYYGPGTFTPQTAPDLNNFGARITGWVSPTVTGDYDLFIRSDDQSQMYFNEVPVTGTTNALPNIFTGTPLVYVDTCCAAFQDPATGTYPNQTTTAPIHLIAGNKYGMVILLKEAGGGDYVYVAWRKSDDTTAPASLSYIPGVNCWTMASSAGHRAVLSVQPKNTTVTEDRPVTFTVKAATLPPTDTYFVQWYSNNVPIPNANAVNYTIPVTTLAQSGAQFKASLLTLVGQLDTTNATLTVVADTNAPVPTAGALAGQGGSYQIGISFDETVNQATLVAGNFTLVGATGTFKLVTNSLNTYASAAFTASGLVQGTTYHVTVKNVADTHGNTIPASGVDVPFTLSKYAYADTGTPIRPGEVIQVGDNGFDVLNGGRAEWGSYDEITMAYTQKTNDFDVKVQVIYAEPSSEWARCGLIARNALNVGEPRDTTTMAAYAQTHVNPNQTLGSSGVWDPSDPIQPVNTTPNNGHEQNTRLAEGIATSGWGSPGTAPVYPNVWLRLARVGDTLHGYRSEDGVTWTDQGTTVLTDQQPVMYVGPFYAVETGNIWDAGQFDVWTAPLDPTYDRLFLGQFRNYGDFATSVLPTIGATRNASGQLVIIYTGVLTSANVANGTYTDVVGATSPYTVPTVDPSKFFRSRK